MKTKTKSVLAIVLSVLMIFSTFSLAFAAEEKATPVIVVSGMGARPLINQDTGKEVFPPETGPMVVNILKAVLPTLLTIATTNGKPFDKYAAEPIHNIFEQLACDNNGNSVYNIVPTVYPKSAANYPEFYGNSTSNETGMVISIAKKIGHERTYYFNYDWRLSPIDIAEDLHKMIEDVKAEHKCSKVSLFAMSMGGTITNAYLYKYGSDSLENVVYASTAFMGVDLVGELFTGNVELSIVPVLTYLETFVKSANVDAVASIIGMLNDAAKKDGMDDTDAFIKKNVDAIKEIVFRKVFKDAFITFPGIWGLLPSDKFDEAVKTMRNYVDLSDSFIAKAKQSMIIQDSTKEMFNKAEANGTNIYIIAAYGYSGIPLTTASASHTDTLIDTYHMSGKCIVAPYGKTLNDVDLSSYMNLPACGNKSHYHISTDGVINAGVGILPDRTWIIKNMTHVEFNINHGTSELAVFVVTSKGGVNVYSDSRYPQFTELDRKTGKLTSLTGNVVIPGTETTLPETNKGFFDKVIDLFKTLVGYIKGYFS